MSVRWNPYVYAGSNPVNYVDPSGEFFNPVSGLIALGSGIVNAGIDFISQGGIDKFIDNLRNGRDPFNLGDGSYHTDENAP